MSDAVTPEAGFLAYLRAWLANLVLASVDIGVSLSCGGVALAGAIYHASTQPHWWFVAGACLPLGPMGWWATSKSAFRAELVMLHDLHEKNLITTAEYDI